MFSSITSRYYVSDYENESAERITNRYELELCTTDNCESWVDGQLYRRINGSIILARPGQRRKSRGYFECHYVHFKCDDPEFKKKYIDTLPTQMFSVDTYKFTTYLKEILFLNQGLQSNHREETKILLDARIVIMILELYAVAQTQLLSAENSGYAANITAACKYI